MPSGFMYSMYPMHPFFGLVFMSVTWLVQLVIAYFVRISNNVRDFECNNTLKRFLLLFPEKFGIFSLKISRFFSNEKASAK